MGCFYSYWWATLNKWSDAQNQPLQITLQILAAQTAVVKSCSLWRTRVHCRYKRGQAGLRAREQSCGRFSRLDKGLQQWVNEKTAMRGGGWSWETLMYTSSCWPSVFHGMETFPEATAEKPMGSSVGHRGCSSKHEWRKVPARDCRMTSYWRGACEHSSLNKENLVSLHPLKALG